MKICFFGEKMDKPQAIHKRSENIQYIFEKTLTLIENKGYSIAHFFKGHIGREKKGLFKGAVTTGEKWTFSNIGQ